MWDPTHVQVTVQRARSLLIKGKNGTNNCFVTIALGKEKFVTSTIKDSTGNVEWTEQCELIIPSQGNTAEIVLKVFNHDLIKDQLLGQVSIPLAGLDVYETPRSRWYALQGKQGKENTKKRGDLEVGISFTVKHDSLSDLGKKEKHKSSLSSVAQNIGGSLMSIGSLEKRKGLKKFAKKLGSKMNLNKKDKNSDSASLDGSSSNLNFKASLTSTPQQGTPKNISSEADPGVISGDEDDFAFDDLSHKSSGSSLNVHSSTLPRGSKYTPSPINASLENLGGGELLRRSVSGNLLASEKLPPKPLRSGLETFAPTSQIPTQVIGQNDEWTQKLYARPKSFSQNMIDKEKSSSLERNKILDSPNSLKEKPSPKFFRKFGGNKSKKLLDERIIVGAEGIQEESANPAYSSIPDDIIKQFQNKTREDLIVMVYNLQRDFDNEKKKIKDLENYLDELLLRVMETTPRILQNPYSRNNSMHVRNK